MSANDSARDRRAFDKVDRQARLRKVWAAILGVVAVFIGATWYWSWDNAEPSRDGAPNWSPDSRSLVFVAEIGAGKGDIYEMNADGSRRRQLTENPANDTSPSISPNGQWIAFESDRDGNSEIYVMDRDGSNVRRLTTEPAADLAPAWSPDSKRIAFTSDRNQRAAADLYVMDADGSNLERLTGDLSNWAPQFSPDGTRVALQIGRDVWLVDLASKARQRLTVEPANGMNPTWSPDGRQIAFVTTRNNKAEIFTMKADGTDPKLLVTMAAGSVIDPRWSPSGSQVAFVLLPDNGNANDPSTRPAIYTIDVTSRVVTRLSK